MRLPYATVDAFSALPWGGNPAAVLLLPAPQPETWMQAVAAEMNLAETAFLVRRSPTAFDLRWFTPTCEVDLCGHATLASAHHLMESGATPAGAELEFHTRSGRLTAQRVGDLIELDFPATPPEPAAAPPDLAAAVGAPVVAVLRSRWDLLVEVRNAATVRDLAPDLTALGRYPVRGVIVHAPGDGAHDGADFVSRFFGPQSGVPEDPVTGSAHCALAPLYAERTGRTDLVGYQASARGGTVRTRLVGDRVRLGGHAVTTLRGEVLF